jgi:hypothetical protein
LLSQTDYIKPTDAQLKTTFYCSFYKMFVPLHTSMFQTLVHHQGVLFSLKATTLQLHNFEDQTALVY